MVTVFTVLRKKREALARTVPIYVHRSVDIPAKTAGGKIWVYEPLRYFFKLHILTVYLDRSFLCILVIFLVQFPGYHVL
jgi:hypothetical protein